MLFRYFMIARTPKGRRTKMTASRRAASAIRMTERYVWMLDAENENAIVFAAATSEIVPETSLT